jgi:hypothetical protein
MSKKETAQTVVEVVEEVIEEVERQPNWKVLRPGGTRDFPDGGVIRVRNDQERAGRYTYRYEGEQAQQRTIQPGANDNYQARVHFYLKNTGNVDLMVDP